MADKEIVHNTYNITKFPTLDETKRTIVFQFGTYYIPPEEGNKLTNFYNRICAEIEKEEKDFSALAAILAEMKPYLIRVKIDPSRRQSAIWDPILGRTLN